MNTSYFRIKDTLENSIERLVKWQGRELQEKIESSLSDCVDHCLDEQEQWKKGYCLYAYENDGWSVFEDMSGSFSGIDGKTWLEFAKDTPFVMAGYNDAIPYGEMIVIEDGQIVKEFFDESDEPDLNCNSGTEYEDISDWVGVADYVDEDELVFSEDGIVLI